MKKQTIIYCYRMTHDYGTNPCVFTKDYEATPELLTEGGCMLQLRRHLKKNWAHQINASEIDAYIMAVAGHSKDGKRWRDELGSFITPKYNHLIFVAKIMQVDLMRDYLQSEKSHNRLDTCYIDQGCYHQKNLKEAVIISDRFKYFGKSSLELPQNILDFFPMGRRTRLNGKPFGPWNAKNGFYHSSERPEDVAELLYFIKEVLGDKNEVVDMPYRRLPTGFKSC